MDGNDISIRIKAMIDGLKSDLSKALNMVRGFAKEAEEETKFTFDFADKDEAVEKFRSMAKEIMAMKEAVMEASPDAEMVSIDGIERNKDEVIRGINEEIERLEALKEHLAETYNVAPNPEEYEHVSSMVGEEVDPESLSIFQKMKLLIAGIKAEFKESAEAEDEVADNAERVNEALDDSEGGLRSFSGKIKEAVDEVKKGVAETVEHAGKLGLRLLGVVTIGQMFSRIVRSAISDNKDIEKTITAITKTLAEMLMPVINWVANALKSLLIMLNSFIYGLTGVNFLAKAMARAEKSAKGTAKAMKQMKQLAGFDEINNLNTQTGGGGGGGGADWTSGLDFANQLNEKWVEIGRKVREVIDWIVQYWNEKVWPALKPVLDKLAIWWNDVTWPFLQKVFVWIGEFASEHVPLVVTAIGVIMTVWNLCTGNILGALVGIGVASFGVWLGMQEDAEDATDSMETDFDGLGTSAGGTFDMIQKEGVSAFGNMFSSFDSNNLKTMNAFTLLGDKIKTKWGEIKTKVVDYFGEIKTKAVNKWGEIKTGITNKFEEIKTSVKEKINGIIGFFEGMANGAIKGINKIIQGLNKIAFDIPDWVPGIGGHKFGFNLKEISMVSIPRLDTGTNFVPQDQLAYIHKGEAVVPKKYNNNGFVNGTEVTNELLSAIVEAVRNIDLRPQVEVTEVGRANDRYSVRMSRQLGVV